jgi:predicted nucleic acid-binding protein
MVAAIEHGRIRATTSVEVVQKFAHLRARRRGRADAAALGRAFGSLPAPLLAPDAEDLAAGLALFERTDLGTFDAVLAATAISHDAECLVSAETAFLSVPGLDVRPLAELGARIK